MPLHTNSAVIFHSGVHVFFAAVGFHLPHLPLPHTFYCFLDGIEAASKPQLR